MEIRYWFSDPYISFTGLSLHSGCSRSSGSMSLDAIKPSWNSLQVMVGTQKTAKEYYKP